MKSSRKSSKIIDIDDVKVITPGQFYKINIDSCCHMGYTFVRNIKQLVMELPYISLDRGELVYILKIIDLGIEEKVVKLLFKNGIGYFTTIQ